ncbi:conserved hypothetical protein [Rippkaea orientalis PCC 8801]|uniref:Uncharacterized protein n=1 Tax=Rippkaea orientalis (strain PCC 8801 / RF-1) TaxID=41431 RepID=B7JV20_RIPO1|nr:hypothetical protein [Rippkaea orientalis]ACK66872.1 conserved hypothetical protein [Rippkaea orientalis PCC 8801]
MNPTTLRHLWSTIEQTQAQTLLSLSQTDLAHCLLTQVEQYNPLTPDEYNHLSVYISLRIALIRDLAHSRLNPQLA